jgi:DNA-3-methyladenine glycosylase I
LETFQAGLSWECILNKRENFRKAYDGFDIDKVCNYGDEKINELMQDAGIIRNRAKLRASVNNSRIYREITREYGSFDAYLQSFTEGKVIREPDISITTSPLSDALSADLKKRGMSFVGSTTIYAFLQAIGVINSHTKDCFCYEQVT